MMVNYLIQHSKKRWVRMCALIALITFSALGLIPDGIYAEKSGVESQQTDSIENDSKKKNRKKKGDIVAVYNYGARLYGKICSRCHKELENSMRKYRNYSKVLRAIRTLQSHEPLPKLTNKQLYAISTALMNPYGLDAEPANK